jgi:FemAB-related protein (PEP-CTERM system-associated)
MDELIVRPAREADAAAWDAYVSALPEATFFHRFGWRRVLDQAFGHTTHYLVAERAGVIEGVLPLAEIRSRLFGHALISTPFCVYGGIAASTDAARSALDRRAQSLAEELGVGHLEYRDRDVSPCPEWPGSDLYVTFRKALDPEPEKNMQAIPRKQRAMVRKGIKAGLKSEIDRDTRRFFQAYSESVHRLGTPVFSRRYFDLLVEAFGPDCDVVTITLEGRVVASVLNFYFRDEVLPYYGGGTAEARSVGGNDFMYWEVLRRAVENGCKVFDYGRSKVGSGSYDFKRNWGFEAAPLNYRYKLVRASRLPENNPNNPKYRVFIQAWQRMPRAMANLIGPHIVRNLG